MGHQKKIKSFSIPSGDSPLFNHYLRINLPGAVVFTLLYLLNEAVPGMHIMLPDGPKWTVVGILLLQGIFAVVLPLWYRILFVNRVKERKNTSLQSFRQFEKKFMSLACPSLYLLIPGYLLVPSKGPFAAMVLFALYSLYFYFPSHKRIFAEKKLFRVQEEKTDDAT